MTFPSMTFPSMTFPSLKKARLLVLSLVLAGGALAGPAQARSGDASACGGGPFVSRARVAGSTATLPATNVSVLIPRGWRGQMGTGADGSPYLLLNAPQAGPQGVVILAASDGSRGLSLAQQASADGGLLANGTALRGPTMRGFSLGADCGVQLLGQANDAEVYVTLVRIGGRTYGVEARYPRASAREMRANLDAIVASASLPRPNAAPSFAAAASGGGGGEGSVVGCWSSMPDSHTTRTINLGSDGSYRWTSSVSGLPYGVEPSVEVGRYRVVGGTLTTSSNNGETSSYDVSRSGGRLMIGSARYFPCD